MEFIEEYVLRIWVDGGWLMGPLFALGLLIYYTVFELYFNLRSRHHQRVDPNLWGHWIDKPHEAEGEIGRIIRFTQLNVTGVAAVRLRFDEVRTTLLNHLRRRIRFVTIIVGTAPLTGLLGTVAGMLTTFRGLSSAEGAGTLEVIAGGISEALITTETGLVLAIPAYVVVSRIRRRIDDLELFLTKLETATLKRSLKLSQPTY